MEPFGSILGALGSVASLVSLLALWKQGARWSLRIALILIFVLTGISSFMTYRHFQITQPEIIRQERQDSLRSSAKLFLAETDLKPSYWDAGKNEGIVKSGLILLEINKDLFPDSYEKIRSDIESDISFAQSHRDKQEHRAAIEAAAQNIITILKALAGSG